MRHCLQICTESTKNNWKTLTEKIRCGVYLSSRVLAYHILSPWVYATIKINTFLKSKYRLTVGSRGSPDWMCVIYMNMHVKYPNASDQWDWQSFPWLRLREITKASPGSCVDTDSMCRKHLLQLPPPGCLQPETASLWWPALY